jgi:hypothetical protein
VAGSDPAAQRKCRGSPPPAASRLENRQADIDVAPGGPGVGAAAVGLGDQGLGFVTREVGDGDPEFDVEGVASLGVLGQGD